MGAGRSRWLFAAIFGVGGVALLAGLGVWQVARLFEKLDQLQLIEAQLAAPPVAVSGDETTAESNFRSALATGRFDPATPAEGFLTSLRPFGPGLRIITGFSLESGRRILVDRGFAPERAEIAAPPTGVVRLRGALHWPREVSGFTPPPNRAEHLWFARDVEALAQALDTAPVMLVMGAAVEGAPPDAWPRPQPVEIMLPNNHLGYAVTWFGLAAVWSVMTVLFLRKRG